MSKLTETLLNATNLDAEKAVLGSIMLESSMVDQASKYLQPSDFFLTSHKLLFAAFLRLVKDVPEGHIDLVTVCDALDGEEQIREVGGKAFISSLIDGLPRYTNIEQYARIVRDYSVRRQLFATCSAIAKRAIHDDDATDLPSQAIAEIEKVLFNQQSTDLEPKTPSDYWDEIREWHLTPIDQRRMVATGLPIDGHLGHGAMVGGQLMFLGAYTGCGKTSMMLNMACDAAINQNKKVLVCSLEMTGQELTNRLMGIVYGLTKANIAAAAVCDWWEAFKHKLFANFEIVDTDDFNAPKLINQIKYIVRTRAIDIVYIDHLHLMKIPGNKFYRKDLEVGEIGSRLKQLSKRLDLPIIALCQFGRAPKKPGGGPPPPPRIDWLKESSALEQIADYVTLPHSPTLVAPGPDGRPAVLEDYVVDVVKSRDGPIGWDQVEYNLITQRMTHAGTPNNDFRRFTCRDINELAGDLQPNLLLPQPEIEDDDEFPY